MTRSDAPSGCTSHRRTARFAIALSHTMSSVTTAAPRILDRFVERRGLEQQRTGIIIPLVAGLIRAAAERTPASGVLADRLR